jgi:hypothetical protein
MYSRNSDNSLLDLINTAIYIEIAHATNNKPNEIGIELNAINYNNRKIKYCEKEAIKRTKKLYEIPDDLERFQAIKFLENNIDYKGNFHALIDKYCKDFTNNLSTSFYNSISENEAQSLVLSNSHSNAKTIIDDISKINKLSKLDNSYIVKSIENFKKYMAIAIEAQFYKSTVLVLKPDVIKKPSIEIPLSKPKSKHQSFTYINNNTKQTQLTDLMNALKRKNLIENSTDLKDFRKAFSGEAIDKPIVWTGNISELSYFIKQLHNNLKLVKHLKQDHWLVANICFVGSDGIQFGRDNFTGKKPPSTSKNIDSTLNTLK